MKANTIDWDTFDWEPCFDAIKPIVRRALVSKRIEGDSGHIDLYGGEWASEATVKGVLDSPSHTVATYLSGMGLATIPFYQEAYNDCKGALIAGMEELTGEEIDKEACHDFLHEQVVEILDEIGTENALEWVEGV